MTERGGCLKTEDREIRCQAHGRPFLPFQVAIS